VFSRKLGDGESVSGAVHGVIAANLGGTGSAQRTRVSSRQRIVQRRGRTVVDESHVTVDDGTDERPDMSEGDG
jgi:hypothetical protein